MKRRVRPGKARRSYQFLHWFCCHSDLSPPQMLLLLRGFQEEDESALLHLSVLLFVTVTVTVTGIVFVIVRVYIPRPTS